jgi:LacI family transcriptional regulator
MSKRELAQPRVTLMDIARACGVSRATVSLVLRGSELVHADTRALVEAEMKRQGYVRNRAAANLRQGTSSSVALVVNDLANPYFAEFAAGVDEALGAVGCVTLLGSTAESVARQQAVLGLLMEHMPAGIILSPAEGSDGASLLRTIGSQVPVLVFNRELPGTDWDFLGMDNRNGARMETEYLLSLGHRRIAFFGGHLGSSSCRQRRQGYLDAMAAAGITPEPQWLIETAPTRLEAATQAGALFVRDPAPTAAVAYNDAVALGLMMGLAARGRRPGHDFAVVGFDDIPEAAVSAPPLTTIATDPRARGRQAAQMILDRAKNRDAPPAVTVAPARLVVRQSACMALDLQASMLRAAVVLPPASQAPAPPAGTPSKRTKKK